MCIVWYTLVEHCFVFCVQYFAYKVTICVHVQTIFVGDVCDVVEKSYPDHDSIEFWRSIEESSDFRTRCHKKVRVQTIFLFRH